ncbi:MAG: hypothetical protein ABEI98_11645 [Halorhabdus sp.]
MTVAERAREAARAHPFVHEALRAGVINYAAAARMLDVGDEEAVAAALRRYASELSGRASENLSAQVTMQSGIGRTNESEDALLAVGKDTFASGEGSLTAVLVTGEIDAWFTTTALARLTVEGIAVEAAGVTGNRFVVVVERRNGPETVQFLEEAIDTLGDPTD